MNMFGPAFQLCLLRFSGLSYCVVAARSVVAGSARPFDARFPALTAAFCSRSRRKKMETVTALQDALRGRRGISMVCGFVMLMIAGVLPFPN